MQNNEPLYSYQYLYNISSTNMQFIKKMITLFTGSLTEYIQELDTLTHTRDIKQLLRLIHKLKPGVLNLEVKGAREEVEILEKHHSWTNGVTESVERLIAIFRTIQPLMLKDLEKMRE